MKKKILLILLVICVLLTGCAKKETTISDSEKFKQEYTNVSEYNVFTYRSADEIIKILEHGTGVVFLGFPECKWCQAYAPMLNVVADTEGLEKIYYYNILEARKNNTEEYQKIVELLEEYLSYDEEGNKRVYVPTVVTVSEGKIVGYDDETSYDTLGYSEPTDYWTEERIANLKDKLSNMMDQIVDNKCDEGCNE